MSLNIQTPTGLLEIGGKVTKEKIVKALGYSPADEVHVEDEVVHITSEERDTWNNKSDVRAYADLLEAPNITEDNSGNLTVADNNGNAIMKVDADGVTTTNVNAQSVTLNGEDLGVRLDELKSVSLPNILDDESGELTIADEEGNTIVKIDSDGLTTTTVTAKNVVVNGQDVGVKFDEQKEEIKGVRDDLATHTTASDIHITSDEREMWNNKSDIHNYRDLPDAPNITEDESGEVVYADPSGNVIARIDGDGFETTNVIANTVTAGGVDIGDTLSKHISETDGRGKLHITSAERTAWNSKVDANYVDEAIANLVDSSPAALDTLNELATALGDDPNFATTVTNQIAGKADQTALDEMKESIESEADEFVIADNEGNKILQVDENGLETTVVTAKNINVSGNIKINGADVQETLGNISSDVSKIKDGDVIVAKATHAESANTATNAENAAEAGHATSADSATKATQDAEGNTITSTYETKNDAKAKLDEAKEYTDGMIADLATVATTGDYNDLENKPEELSDEELFAWLNDANVITPVSNSAGELYVTNNNEIYVL